MIRMPALNRTRFDWGFNHLPKKPEPAPPIQQRMVNETPRSLTSFQGRQVGVWRDERPGGLLHELRAGALAWSRNFLDASFLGTSEWCAPTPWTPSSWLQPGDAEAGWEQGGRHARSAPLASKEGGT